ncbi:hypothetical protein GCM10010123_12410 [Pilimelia anulata]|uniref:Uncharacterized protein n=1 Tax=Pilimelia anulata TaxID=53371 RepID=A0A8J3B1U4_9ACTN|nr:hypothetical protein GCM10010123_12410 [Pilimelia anulata]
MALQRARRTVADRRFIAVPLVGPENDHLILRARGRLGTGAGPRTGGGLAPLSVRGRAPAGR